MVGSCAQGMGEGALTPADRAGLVHAPVRKENSIHIVAVCSGTSFAAAAARDGKTAHFRNRTGAVSSR